MWYVFWVIQRVKPEEDSSHITNKTHSANKNYPRAYIHLPLQYPKKMFVFLLTQVQQDLQTQKSKSATN